MGVGERTYWINVHLRLQFEIRADSPDEARRLGMAAGEFAVQCARWEDLREFQEIHLIDAEIDPELTEEVPGDDILDNH